MNCKAGDVVYVVGGVPDFWGAIVRVTEMVGGPWDQEWHYEGSLWLPNGHRVPFLHDFHLRPFGR